MIVVRNELSGVLDIEGAGLVFEPLESKSIDSITPELAAAIQNGLVSVTSQADGSKIIVASNGQTLFDLPFPWPGPENCHLVVAGLVRLFGVDFSIDAANNQMTWLNGGVVLAENDVLFFLKNVPSPLNEVSSQLSGDGGLADGAVTGAKLSAALLPRFGVVGFGADFAVGVGVRGIEMQLKDLAGDNLAGANVVRITCDPQATLSLGAHGSLISGDNTADLIAKTSVTGLLSLEVACAAAVEIFVVAGATQASPMLDCRATGTVTFV